MPDGCALLVLTGRCLVVPTPPPFFLQASVFHVPEAESCGNLVAHVKVPALYNEEKQGVPVAPWVLFNDFAVQHVKKEDVVSFNMDWKVPCILYYTLRGGVNSKVKSLDANIPIKQFK